MAKVTLKGREIPLLYTVWEMKQMAEEVAPIGKAINILLGRNPDNPEDTSGYCTKEHISAVGKAVAILGNAGLEDAGEEPNLTEKWVLRAMRPADMAGIVTEVIGAMSDGMASEIPDRKQDGPVDVTLEEMNKKKEKEN